MKKIILFIMLAFITIVVMGQPAGETQESNLTIRNATPMLHLRGEGAVLNFYNGDLRLTRSPNVLTLTGGIFKIGTDTAATQAYARAHGSGSGSMTYPGAGIPLSTGAAWGVSITNNSTNWNTAYTDRLKWDGGATGLTAATGRTSLGGTTVGQNIFTLANPSAITFLRMNADNTVTALSATNFKTALSLENVTNESKATMFTNPTFTGVPVAPTAAVGTSTTQVATTAYVQNEFSVGETLSDIVPLLADTIPLFTAGYGWGAATDTTGIDITADFGGWYNDGSDTVQLAKVAGRVKASKNPPTITINIYIGDNTDDVANCDSVFTAGMTITSTTTGDFATSFLNAKIPPGKWVAVYPCASLGLGTKPSKLRLSVSGYKIPTY